MSFVFNWVLINKLSIGTPIRSEEDVYILKRKNIKSIISLCASEKLIFISEDFIHEKFELPDHKYGKCPEINEINKCIKKIEQLLKNGSVFVHCEASIERSPLICIAWLILKENIPFEHAVQYLKEVHPKSNPHYDQLEVLKSLKI